MRPLSHRVQRQFGPFSFYLICISWCFNGIQAFSSMLRTRRLVTNATARRAVDDLLQTSRRRLALNHLIRPWQSQGSFYPTAIKLENNHRLFSTAAPQEVAIAPAYIDIELDPIANELDYDHLDGALPPQNHDTINESVEQRLQRLQIRSQTKPGGNWKPSHPVDWAKHFGTRSAHDSERLKSLVQLPSDHPNYHDVSNFSAPDGVTMVRTREHAKRVVARLMDAATDGSVMHACDTEVMDIDLKSVGPVGNGYVTCLSVYSGPDFDYGDGPGKILWIDNLDDACGVLQEFKEWLEDDRHYKVWHNYGFDRHVLWNEGILVKGLGGDTMHMARLENTARAKPLSDGGGGKGYSLEVLTDELVGKRKRPMKEVFGVPRTRKDGSPGSLVDIPAVEELQRNPQFRQQWIEYSCFDAQGTWLIRDALEEKLRQLPWIVHEQKKYTLYEYYMMHMRPFAEVLTDMERRGIRVDAKDYLASVEMQARQDRARHFQKFREWAATKIGPNALALNVASSVQLQTLLFGGAVNEKTKEIVEAVRTFKVPREEIPEDALIALAKRDEEELAASDPADAKDHLEDMKAVQLKALCKEYGLKVSGKKADLQDRIRQHLLSLTEPQPADGIEDLSETDLRDALIARGISCEGTKAELLERYREDIDYTEKMVKLQAADGRDDYAVVSQMLEQTALQGGTMADHLSHMQQKATEPSKFVDVTISGLGLAPEKYTTGGAPSVTADVIARLAGDPFSDPPKYGTAYAKFGKEGCEAFASLAAIGSIDTMIANFLTSLQELADSESRVHCSLNLNTETGRLSSRRPNLQNQPALEKDKYKIRKAFQSSPGNNLIVADYGQLELRILASITHCQSMIDAFDSGGDFHSRTAIDMFPYVKNAVDQGDCLLEWDYSQGSPPKPLLKDEYASERRKAKTLNFSIAYGKTAHGLSADWGVSVQEAEEMLKAWYAARPEVQKWQANTKQIARDYGITRTLHGRYRHLPDARTKNRKFLGHAERASINTPIQGGAADIAMMAMIKINESEKLRQLGWILLLQIHDEVILEGPEETAEEAFEEVLKCMQQPWVFGLDPMAVPLLVDGSCEHKTWYDAK
ncbi:hypothetical protein MPSEU_000392400 [Mayamaea pseudoterrestris]|nr:hypothetical protein MPSEU_000392400 [Mayamaea pseudoterrestris]